jgi:acyl-coenzyme A synthetase/AMP-(fatty) acid ligase
VKTDEDGYIYFVSREDEMIKCSGYRVSPTEIEEILYGSGNVKHAAAFGIPDQILGQVIAAVVSPQDGIPVDKKALIKHCSQNLPNYLVPREIEVWDNLPLNPNGKIDRKAIMADFLKRDTTQ